MGACPKGATLAIKLPGCLLYAGNLALVSQFAEADTADAELTEISVRAAADLAAVVLSGGELLLLLLFQNHSFLCHRCYLLLVLCEGSAEELEQLACFFIGICGGYKADVHTADLLDLIVLDFGEDQLLFQTERVVAATVESVGVDTLKVTNSGQREVEQSVKPIFLE